MTKQETATTSKIRMRIAALALFVAQGVVFASWASRLPDIKADFNVADLLQFSIVLFLIPIGKFVAIPLVSFLFPRIGSKKTVLISILGFTLSLFVIGFISSDVYSLGVVMFFFGMFWNMTDISLNTHRGREIVWKSYYCHIPCQLESRGVYRSIDWLFYDQSRHQSSYALCYHHNFGRIIDH